MNNTFLTGKIQVNDGFVPLISTHLIFKDFLGAVMVRWGIRRGNYRVEPGLYAVGSPGPASDNAVCV